MNMDHEFESTLRIMDSNCYRVTQIYTTDYFLGFNLVGYENENLKLKWITFSVSMAISIL